MPDQIIATQSGLLDWEACPRLHEEKRRGAGDTGSHYAEVGTLVHRALEAVTRGRMTHAGTDPIQIARATVLAAAGSSRATDEALGLLDRALAPSSPILGMLMPRSGETIWCEVRLALDADLRPCDDEARTAYAGTLDRLATRPDSTVVCVDDLKTTHDHMSSEDLREDAQARWYSFLALQSFPDATEVRFRRVNVRSLYAATAWFRREDTSWSTRIVARMQRFRNGAAATRAITYTAEVRITPGSHCRWCPARATCSGYSGVPFAGDDPALLAREWRVAQKRAEELGETVRAIATRDGPIDLGNEERCGLREKNSTELAVEPDRALEVLRREGLRAADEAAIFKPSERSLPGMVRRAIETVSLTKAQTLRLREELLNQTKTSELTNWRE